MKHIRTVTFAVISLFAAGSGTAQEKFTFEEILRYFPAGIYSEISHSEHFDLSRQPAWEMHIKYEQLNVELSRGPDYKHDHLMDYLHDNALSHTSARYHSDKYIYINVELTDDPDTNRIRWDDIKQQYPEHAADIEKYQSRSEDNPGSSGFGIAKAHDLKVSRYSDIKELINDALKKKIIVRTGLKVRSKPVFSSSPTGSIGKKRYLYPLPSNDLLISDDLKGIKIMLDTNDGLLPGFQENERYHPLIDLKSELDPYYWSFSDHHHHHALSETTDEETMKRFLFTWRPMFITFTQSIRDVVINKYFLHFHEKVGDPQMYYDRIIGNRNDKYPEYNKLLKKRTSHKISGKMMIHIKRMDEALFSEELKVRKSNMKEHRKFLEEMKREREERKRQREQ